MDKAKELGFKNFRLYTDVVDNNIAANLYRKMGMIEEEYVKEILREKYTIFSKSLILDRVEKWNNRMLFFEEQEKILFNRSL